MCRKSALSFKECLMGEGTLVQDSDLDSMGKINI